jgi:hypothetical protein
VGSALSFESEFHQGDFRWLAGVSSLDRDSVLQKTSCRLSYVWYNTVHERYQSCTERAFVHFSHDLMSRKATLDCSTKHDLGILQKFSSWCGATLLLFRYTAVLSVATRSTLETERVAPRAISSDPSRNAKK